VLIEEGFVESFHEAVALWPTDFGGSMFNAFELEENLVGVPVGPTAVLPAVVTEHSFDLDPGLLAEGQDVLIEDMNSGYGQFGVVESCPGISGVAVDSGLEVDSSHPFERSHVEGIHCYQIGGMLGLDMALPELGTESFQETDLLVSEVDFPLPDRFFQPEQAFMFGEKVMPIPDTPDSSGADLNPFEG